MTAAEEILNPQGLDATLEDFTRRHVQEAAMCTLMSRRFAKLSKDLTAENNAIRQLRAELYTPSLAQRDLEAAKAKLTAEKASLSHNLEELSKSSEDKFASESSNERNS